MAESPRGRKADAPRKPKTAASHKRRAAPSAPDARRPALAVLYRSDTLLAVDKPQGIIVHGDGTGAATLTDAVRTLIKRAPQGTFPANATDDLQALQRLDRDTSGIVLFSLNKPTQPVYDRLIAEHALTKRYLAVAAGRAPWNERTIDAPIGRDRHDARRMRVSRTGKPARTRIRVIGRARRRDRDLTLLSVEILTGRKHQIRVHLAHCGLPLLGDALYGAPASCGLMLHAAELRFCDPLSGETITITSPAPERFRALFPRLG